IIGGGHCYFGDSNFLCQFGETTCGPSLSISRAEQHDVVTDLATLWLDHYLRDDDAALMAFEDSMAATTRAATQYACLSTGDVEFSTDVITIWPSPAAELLNVGGLPPNASITIMDALGRTYPVRALSTARSGFDVSALPAGAYLLAVTDTARKQVLPFLVVR
ncbi:MAG TPA: T9SS type A sorting domain-containing protein, partial [Flavobacteriales bacterium]|nr:T9SS type A sorting domain-containing protein [Flavobacteriales bacterium]